MSYIIKIEVAQSELNEFIPQILANGWNICGVDMADETPKRIILIRIPTQAAKEPPLRRI